ncbi:MAG TPA: Asp23/Gls24 family envelope stress response protein [Firmicutes bacterium]|nr:Asp23/Gls24 family envelope stress response protein [Bacillota bacterium]
MEVIALVGRSGTGKSYRASIVANRWQADLIIDDGLLIKDSKIVAGTSAKKEPTKLKAVRRALFWEPGDALAARAKIRELQPERILVLGTSQKMIERITESLNLPSPSKYVNIREVSSPEDIKRALRIRKEQGKHVIPAATLEVKKTFSGYLVDPLRFFIRPRGGLDGYVVEKSIVRPTYSSFGRFYIADSVIMTIVLHEAASVPGVEAATKALVETKPEGVVISIDVVLRYGVSCFDVMKEVQKRVAFMVDYLTALYVISVNVRAKSVSCAARGDAQP